MAALRIDLPDNVKAVAESRAAECGRSIDEYLSALIQADAEQEVDETLEAELLAGLDSGPATELEPNFWSNLKSRIRGHQRPTSP
jgi:plasmid stability protein